MLVAIETAARKSVLLTTESLRNALPQKQWRPLLDQNSLLYKLLNQSYFSYNLITDQHFETMGQPGEKAEDFYEAGKPKQGAVKQQNIETEDLLR